MKKRKIIFVGGVHGVGKTTFCKAMASRFGIGHFSASDLIAIERQEEHRLDKQVENISKNQDVLVKAINKHFKNNDWNLLDGHFCLLSKDRQITKIQITTYEDINPGAIIILYEKPENIASRLRQRDNIKHNLSLLQSFQEQELSYAKYVSNKLDIPCLVHNVGSSEEKTLSFVNHLIIKGVS